MAYGPNDLPLHPLFALGLEQGEFTRPPSPLAKMRQRDLFKLGPDGKVLPIGPNGPIEPVPQKTNQLAPDPRQRLAAALLNGGK